MDKTTQLGIAAAISALVALPAAAQPQAVPPANSFAELLDPIPNAAARLRLADAQEPEARLIEAQYAPGPPVVAHHHHHHHHWRRHHRHHHHHHHHNNY